MNSRFQACSLASLALLYSLGAPRVGAAVYTFDNINNVVPDNSPTGLADARTISNLNGSLSDVTVTLNLVGEGADGGFNGDLYAIVEHNGVSVTLLNRPGRTTANALGYSDNGLNVTFSDASPNDVHLYQNVVSIVPGSPLTGVWQPDGRATDPSSVLDTDPKTKQLADFKNQSGNGEWVIFVADLSPGGQVKLKSWALNLQTQAVVPEPTAQTAVAIAALLGFAAWRRLKNQRG